jgi:hypothetical protein
MYIPEETDVHPVEAAKSNIVVETFHAPLTKSFFSGKNLHFSRKTL